MTETAAGLAWFLVHTKAHAERLTQEALERRGFVVYLPMGQRFVTHARKREVVARPLFPRYLFVGLDPDVLPFSTVRGTYGVQWLVSGSEGRPVRVPAKIVADIQAAEIAGLWDETKPKPKSGPGLAPGDEVKHVGGALAEFAAEILSVKSGRRVEILLKRFGSSMRVTAPVARLSKLSL